MNDCARGRWHALWLLVPFACSQEEQLPSWEPSSRGGDSGDLSWSPFGFTFATGQRVSVDVSLHFSKTTCTEPSGCAPGGCFSEERTAALRSVAFSCEGAGCSIVETIELDSSVRVTVEGTRSGRAILRGRGKDEGSGKFFSGESHLDFHDPEELVFLRRPLAAPGTTHALLVGSAFEWCLSVRATDATGEAIELWAKDPPPTLTITGPVVATLVNSPPSGPARPYDPRARYVCHAYRAPAAGDAVITSELNHVEARAALAVRAPETTISAVIRNFRGVEILPVWMPVAEEPAGFSDPLARIEGTARQSNLGLFVSTLTLSDGSTSFGGVGAMTLGPSGVATLLDASVGPSSDTNLLATYGTTPHSDIPHVTRSLFSVATHTPGRATLRLAVGSADLSIPVEVAGSAGVGGSGGSAGARGDAGESGTGGAGGEAGGTVAGASGSGDDIGGAAGAF